MGKSEFGDLTSAPTITSTVTWERRESSWKNSIDYRSRSIIMHSICRDQSSSEPSARFPHTQMSVRADYTVTVADWRGVCRCWLPPGTYNDGLEWLQQESNRFNAKFVMSLGSSIGNFTREEASEFLQRFARVLDQKDDAMLIGLDGCQDRDRV